MSAIPHPAVPPPGDDLASAERDEGRIVFSPILLQYWQSLVRWRFVIIGIVAVCLAVGVVVTLLMPSTYTARTQIEISREQKNVTNVEGLDSQTEGRDLEFYATQHALLKAESLAQRVARKLDLANSKAFFAAHGAELAILDATSDKRAPAQERQREREATAMLLANVEIAPIRTSRLVDLKYTSRSPELSARIANTWTQEFIGATMDRQFASTADARKFLEDRLAALRTRLESSERDVVTYATSNDIVTLDSIRDAEGRTFTQRTLASADLEALNQALTAARAERISAESKARGSAENSEDLLNNPLIGQLRAKQAETAAEYAKLLVQFEPGYPDARALKQQLSSLDAAIDRETRRVSGSRVQNYQQAMTRENELESRVNSLKVDLDRQRQASIQYNTYQREADTNRQLYDALLQRYKEIGVAGTVGASNIAIVDSAKIPTSPSSPNLPLNLALALLVGLGLAALTVLALEQIDEGIRHPEDVRTFLRLPLLGNVPLADDSPIGELDDPKSHIAEAYFSVRSTLAFSTNSGLPRSIAVTSTQQGEGKSTTALALAEIIGRTGKRALLIDGDLRSPSLHDLLGIANDAGLSNLLAGEEHVNGFVGETGQRGVFALTSGPLPPSPAELLSSDRFGELLAMFAARYDHIIVDAPPVLGLADAPLIGRATQGVVYVIEAENTRRRAIGEALQRLEAVGSHILGVVVTKTDFSRYGYGYGYGYGAPYGGRKDVDQAG